MIRLMSEWVIRFQGERAVRFLCEQTFRFHALSSRLPLLALTDTRHPRLLWRLYNTSLVCSKRILKARQEGHSSSTRCKYLINISHKPLLKVSLLISKVDLEFNANQIRIMKQIHNDFVKEVEIPLLNMFMTSWRRCGSTLMIRNTDFFFAF